MTVKDKSHAGTGMTPTIAFVLLTYFTHMQTVSGQIGLIICHLSESFLLTKNILNDATVRADFKVHISRKRENFVKSESQHC